MFPVIVAELEDFELAERVVQVFGIVRAAQGFLASRFVLVLAVVVKESRRFGNRHALAMHFDGDTLAAESKQCFVHLGQAIFGGSDTLFSGRGR